MIAEMGSDFSGRTRAVRHFETSCGDTLLMQKEKRPRILIYQSAGFLAIIGLAWLDECLGLSSLILGNHTFLPEFHVSTLEMLLVLAVWLLVSTATRRVLEHVRRLEGFLKLCAWCHRVEHKG